MSEKFLRPVTYVDKTELGLRLMRPNAILSMKLLKLCMGYIRVNVNARKLTRIQRENASVEKGIEIRMIGRGPLKSM